MSRLNTNSVELLHDTNISLRSWMKCAPACWIDEMLKGHSAILILIAIVVGGIYYSINSANSLLVRKPFMLDSKCYGVNVAKSLKLSDMANFCACIKMGGHVSKAENYKYCLNQFNK